MKICKILQNPVWDAQLKMFGITHVLSRSKCDVYHMTKLWFSSSVCFISNLKEGLWCLVPSVLVKEQAEEVYWLLFTVSLHLWVGAKVWRVELTGVGNPNDVVEEAREQKDSNITMTGLQICLSFLLNTFFLQCWSYCELTLSTPIQTGQCGTLCWQECIRIQWPCSWTFLCRIRDENACVNKHWDWNRVRTIKFMLSNLLCRADLPSKCWSGVLVQVPMSCQEQPGRAETHYLGSPEDGSPPSEAFSCMYDPFR